MSRRVKHSLRFYKTAIMGAVDSKGNRFMGLRSAAIGFEAADGFDMRRVTALTPAQKGKITKYWHELQELTAQHKYVYCPRRADYLYEAQILGGHKKGLKFKVAFLPASEDAKIVHTAQGIQIHELGFSKRLPNFDALKLATSPEAEIKRVMDMNPKATRFQIRADKNLIGQVGDRRTTIRKILLLMEKYDGVSELPQTSGNRGDSPENHHYEQWLHGLVAYEVDEITREDMRQYLRVGERENKKLRKARRAMRKRNR
jgi:hypothetical protein